MTVPAPIQLEGKVVARQPHAERLIFSLDVGGTVFKCFDAFGTMGEFDVLTGQWIICHGQWSTGVLDYFEVERIEKRPV